MTTSYTKADLEYIIKGGCFLGSGGGGTLSSAQYLLDHFGSSPYYRGDTVEVVSKESAVNDREHYAVVLTYIGAPEALKGAAYPSAILEAVTQMQEEYEGAIKYLIPIEMGALGFASVPLVANALGLQVVDCDGAGRAIPELTMTTYAVNSVSPNPAILANSTGKYIRLETGGYESDNSVETIESLIRPTLGLKEFNQIGGLAIWIMDSDEMEEAIQITDSFQVAHSIGRYIVENSDYDPANFIEYLRSEPHNLEAYSLFEGLFVEEECHTAMAGGFDRGQIVIASNSSDAIFTGLFQNETLLGWSSDYDAPVAVAPDSIAYYIDDDTRVYSNGDLITKDGKLNPSVKGKRVTVIGIAAQEVLRTPTLLEKFRKVLLDFGYAGAYTKLEEQFSFENE